MRKLLALVLATYLLTFWMPLLALADEYNSNAERCYWTGADCDGVSQSELDAIEANDGVDANAQQDGETDCEYNGSNCDVDFGDSSGDIVVEGSDEDLARALEAPLMCPFEDTAAMTFEYGTKTAQEKADAYEFAQSAAGAKISASYSADNCGEPNSYSKYLEKGDCTAAGLVVTELTETIAPDTEIDENNRIITTYAGLCCFAGETVDGSADGKVVACDDTRTLYTKTYSECSAVAVNCEKRQWVIGGSGIGIVQLMVKQIFYFAAFAVGSIAVSTMVFQGIKISVSGVSGDISDAKNKILQALSGIVLLFLSGLILYIVNPGFFG